MNDKLIEPTYLIKHFNHNIIINIFSQNIKKLNTVT